MEDKHPNLNDEQSLAALVCPMEILAMIFENLDSRSLIRCRRVCKCWKIAADDKLKYNSTWENFCCKEFKDSCGTINCKPSLLWHDIYKCLLSWKRLAVCNVRQYEIKELYSLYGSLEKTQFSSDGVLMVKTKYSILYFDRNTLKLCQDPKNGEYKDYDENDAMKVAYALNDTLYLCAKPQCAYTKVIENVKAYTLHDELCYYMTKCNKVYRWDSSKANSEPEVIVAGNDLHRSSKLHIWEDTLFSASTDGFIWTINLLDPQGLKRIYQIDIDCTKTLPWNIFLFGRISFLYSSQSKTIIGNRDDFHIMKNFPHVSTFLHYGGIIFLGTHCGKVLIYHLNEGNLLVNVKPTIAFELNTGLKWGLDPITSLDAYDDGRKHFLAILTNTRMFVLRFDHSYTSKLKGVVCRSDEGKYFIKAKHLERFSIK